MVQQQPSHARPDGAKPDNADFGVLKHVSGEG
jgi:hypothetical protein